MAQVGARRGRRAVALLVSGGIALGVGGTEGAGAATARPAASTVAPGRQVPFAGELWASGPAETVDVAGRLHVDVVLSGSESGGWSVDWRVNLDRTDGTGRATGDRYRATGSDGGSVSIPPGPPVRTATFEPSFTLFPPGPPVHPPSPCRFVVQAGFDGAGRLTSVEVRLAGSAIGTVD